MGLRALRASQALKNALALQPEDLVNRVARGGDERLGCCGEACRASCALESEPCCAEPAQAYERHAEDYTHEAEQTDDPVCRKMLLTLALQWRLAAQEEATKQSTEPKTADRPL